MEDLKVALVTKLKDFISGGLKRVETRLQSVEARSKELDAKLRALRGFKDLGQQMGALEKKEQELSQEHMALKMQKVKLEAQLKKLTRAYEKGKISTSEFEESQEKLKSELLSTERRLTKLDAQLKQTRLEKARVERETLKLRQELGKLGIEVRDVDRLIEQYERELSKLGDTAQETSGKLGLITKGLKGLGTVGGTALLGGAVKGMFDLDREVRKIIANTTLEWSKYRDVLVKDVAQIKADTLSDYEEVSSVITKLIQQTGKYDASVRETARSILLLKKSIREGWDEGEITRAVTQIQKAWGVTGKEAAQIISTVYQKAGDKAGDLLDTFWEYSDVLAEAGIKADEFAAILIAGAQKGAFNYDRIADAMKEALSARLVEAGNIEKLLGDVESQQEGLIDQLWGRGSREWTRMKSALVDYVNAVQQGDRELAKSSFVNLVGEVTKAYRKDAVKTKEILEGIFGAMGAEDLAKDVLSAIGEAIRDKEKYLKGAKDLEQNFRDSLTAFDRLQQSWEKVWQNLVVQAQPAFEVMSRGLEVLAGFMEKHSTLTGALVGGVAVVGSLGLALKGLSMAYGVAKSGLMTVLTPLRLFKKESSALCNASKSSSLCIQGKVKSFGRLGGVLTRVRGALGSVGRSALFAGGKLRLLAGTGRLLLGGLRLIGLTNPFGLLLTGLTIVLPKLWKLIGGFEGVKKGLSKIGGVVKKAFDFSPLGVFIKGIRFIAQKVKGLSSILSGLRSLPLVGSFFGKKEGGVEAVRGQRFGRVEEVRRLENAGRGVAAESRVKGLNFAPTISITIPSVNVGTDAQVADVKSAVKSALEEGSEEILNALRSLMEKWRERDERVL